MSRRKRLALVPWLLPCMALLGCAGRPVFVDAPPVWQVDDQRDIAEPKKREFDRTTYYAKIYLIDRVDRALRLPTEQPARNTNSLDEVPSSSWFQNRIGARTISPEEAALGAASGTAPVPPLTIIGGKLGRGSPGFMIRDRAGQKFLIKFDARDNPELHTASDIVVSRIFWSLGYNVPDDRVFELRRDDLRIGSRATYTNDLKHQVSFDEASVDAILAHAPAPRGGRYRALASRLLDGKPKGGFAKSGTRPDDPNDVVPHEHRRELRGLRVFAAWVGHTDMKEDNTLDMYVTQGGARFLKHYLVDFDAALNEHAVEMDRPEDGWEYFVDWPAQTKALLAFGLWKRPWEDVEPSPWPAVGTFSARPFEPRAWRETYPYDPFTEMDAADAYWAAKLVMRFDRPLLRAIVEQARLSEPRAADYLVDTLLARRDAVGRAFLDAVTPLDWFETSAREWCATDLAAFYGLAAPGVVERLDDSRVVAAWGEDARGRVCVQTPERPGYVVYRLRVRRGTTVRPALELHVKAGPRPTILGLVRALP